jgi:hypothetical protein
VCCLCTDIALVMSVVASLQHRWKLRNMMVAIGVNTETPGGVCSVTSRTCSILAILLLLSFAPDEQTLSSRHTAFPQIAFIPVISMIVRCACDICSQYPLGYNVISYRLALQYGRRSTRTISACTTMTSDRRETRVERAPGHTDE